MEYISSLLSYTPLPWRSRRRRRRLMQQSNLFAAPWSRGSVGDAGCNNVPQFNLSSSEEQMLNDALSSVVYSDRYSHFPVMHGSSSRMRRGSDDDHVDADDINHLSGEFRKILPKDIIGWCNDEATEATLEQLLNKADNTETKTTTEERNESRIDDSDCRSNNNSNSTAASSCYQHDVDASKMTIHDEIQNLYEIQNKERIHRQSLAAMNNVDNDEHGNASNNVVRVDDNGNIIVISTNNNNVHDNNDRQRHHQQQQGGRVGGGQEGNINQGGIGNHGNNHHPILVAPPPPPPAIQNPNHAAAAAGAAAAAAVVAANILFDQQQEDEGGGEHVNDHDDGSVWRRNILDRQERDTRTCISEELKRLKRHCVRNGGRNESLWMNNNNVGGGGGGVDGIDAIELIPIPIRENNNRNFSIRRICIAVFTVVTAFTCTMIQTIPLVMDDDDGGGDEEQDIRIIGGGGGGGMIIGEEEAEESFSLSSLMFSLSPSSSIGSRGRQRGRRKGGDSVDPLLHELMDIDDIVKYIVNDDEQSFLSSSSSACEEMWRRNVEYSNKVPAALSASRFLSPIITEPVVCNSMDLSSMWKIVFSKMSYWWQLEKKKWIYDVTRFVQDNLLDLSLSRKRLSCGNTGVLHVPSIKQLQERASFESSHLGEGQKSKFIHPSSRESRAHHAGLALSSMGNEGFDIVWKHYCKQPTYLPDGGEKHNILRCFANNSYITDDNRTCLPKVAGGRKEDEQVKRHCFRGVHDKIITSVEVDTIFKNTAELITEIGRKNRNEIRYDVNETLPRLLPKKVTSKLEKLLRDSRYGISSSTALSPVAYRISVTTSPIPSSQEISERMGKHLERFLGKSVKSGVLQSLEPIIQKHAKLFPFLSLRPSLLLKYDPCTLAADMEANSSFMVHTTIFLSESGPHGDHTGGTAFYIDEEEWRHHQRWTKRRRHRRGLAIEPSEGRVLISTGGMENMRCRLPVKAGVRVAVQIWWRCDCDENPLFF